MSKKKEVIEMSRKTTAVITGVAIVLAAIIIAKFLYVDIVRSFITGPLLIISTICVIGKIVVTMTIIAILIFAYKHFSKNKQ